MVEVDGVAEVDPVELVEGGVRVGQRRVEVDARDRRFERLGRDAGERAVDLREPRRHALRALRDGAAVVVDGVGAEERVGGGEIRHRVLASPGIRVP